ncbi:VOC family protein [Gynuella sunshinyii]|nr:VOC family protein [Gynuella sunshinyii]
MMRIEHVNLIVTDIDASIRFYQAAMPHWSVRASGEMDWYGRHRHWVHFGDDYHYLTLNDHGDGRDRLQLMHQVGVAHVGIEISSVDQLLERMEQAGYTPHQQGKGDERQNAYFLDPDGTEIEFVQYFSDQPDVRNR